MSIILSRYLVRYLPLLLGVAILAVAVPLVPWGEVWPYLARLSPLAYVLLIVASAVFYLGRILRYWLMLRMLGHPLSFDKVALACLVAQPVAVLPGGELYRSAMLKRYGNIPIKHGVPSVSAQAIADSIGLLLVALVGALLLQRYVGVLLAMSAVLAGVWLFIWWNNSQASHRLLSKLPGVHVTLESLRSYLEQNRFLLTGQNFFVLLLASFFSTLAGVTIVYIAAWGIGANLGIMHAVVVYAVPMCLESLTFLPGGLGVNEQGSVYILTLLGISLPMAVALTLIVRLFTLGMGFVYGFAAMGWAAIAKYERFD